MTPEPPPPPEPQPAPGALRTLVRRVLFSADGHLRSGWVLLLFLVANGVLGWLGAALTGWLFGPGGHSDLTVTPRSVTSMVLQLATLVAATWIAARLGRFRMNEPHLADRHWARRLGAGLVAGAGLVSLAALIPWAADELGFAVSAAPAGEVLASVGRNLLLLVPAATREEVAVRGLLLHQLARGLGGMLGGLILLLVPERARWIRGGELGGRSLAVVLTGGLFGLAHAANPGASAFAVANVALVGLMFGALTLRQGSLWAATGFHIAWNCVLGPFWGLPISGLDAGLAVLEPTKLGDPLWTGGGFGPEASAVTTVLLALALLGVLWMPVREVANRPQPVADKGPVPPETAAGQA